jgi:hypothetical protein
MDKGLNTSMKNILVDILKADTSYNKSATKMLRNTHPNLWASILEATTFLPNDAKPKQRVWHILNEQYNIPICSVTGQQLKWKEKEYLKFSSIAAKNKGIGKIISESTTDNHWRQKNPDKSKKANKKFSNGFAEGKHKPWNDRNRDYVESVRKTKLTWIKKYGVDNPSKCPNIQKKISAAALKRYGLTTHLRTAYELYYNSVKLVTNKNWYEHFYKINPTQLQRNRDLHLDHVYSIAEGFKNNIPAYIIGHWTNLRLLAKIENSSKGAKCHKTQEKLFEDFFNEIQV